MVSHSKKKKNNKYSQSKSSKLFFPKEKIMDKKKKKIILLIVLIPAMIFFILQVVTATKKKSPPVTDSGVASVSEERSPGASPALSGLISAQMDLSFHPLAEPGPEEAARKEISRAALAAKDWPRDPFLPPVTRVKKDPLADVRLQGIVWHSSSATAIIGGNIYRVGDTFLGITVKEITRDTVRLEKAGREFILKMSDGR